MPSLPWDNPEHNVLADLQAAKERMRTDHYENQKPPLHEWEAKFLEAEGFYVDRSLYHIIPEGYEVTIQHPNLVEHGLQRLEEVAGFGSPIYRGGTDSVAIVSGGLDSTTLVYEMLNQGYVPHLLSFDYGQRHKKELQYAAVTAKNLRLHHDIVDLTGITHLISNSALTTNYTPPTTEPGNKPLIEVPDGHYAEETMKATVVPNRNMIMLSIAAGVAVNNSYRCIATGVHSGDHFIYPDCRPRFIRAANAAVVLGNQGFGGIPEQRENTYATQYIIAPFIDRSKADIALRALELDVPLHLTWSCYKGGEKHCGRCGTCVERLEAINEAQTYLLVEGVADPKYVDHTEYADTEFWKTAVRDSMK